VVQLLQSGILQEDSDMIINNTVVGVFEDGPAILDALVDSGISRSEIYTGSSADWGVEAAAGGAGLTGREPSHRQGGIMAWLDRMFGAGLSERDRAKYADAVRRGHWVVAVNTPDGNCDRVVDILERLGPLDLYELERRSDRVRVYTRAVDDPADEDGVDPYAERQEIIEITEIMIPLDDFRRDYEIRYAGSGRPYEAYASAYTYGYRMASEGPFPEGSFEDVEQHLQNEYLRQHPESTWDRIRGAVRYGWQKVMGENPSAGGALT
jgi:hypothetical protein